MQHAEFEKGKVLFDAIHCRNVKIIDGPGHGDLRPGELFVEAMDESGDTYNINKEDLFTRDEISTVLSHRNIDDHLEEIRRQRIVDKAPLLRHIEFDPKEITEERIEKINTIHNRLNNIWTQVQKSVVSHYIDKRGPAPDKETLMHLIIDTMEIKIYKDKNAH